MLILVALATLVVIIRYNLVFSYRLRAIKIVYGNNSPVDWRVYQRTSFRDDMLSLRKWTFNQFYPAFKGR